jgi:hypothetical protein
MGVAFTEKNAEARERRTREKQRAGAARLLLPPLSGDVDHHHVVHDDRLFPGLTLRGDLWTGRDSFTLAGPAPDVHRVLSFVVPRRVVMADPDPLVLAGRGAASEAAGGEPDHLREVSRLTREATSGEVVKHQLPIPEVDDLLGVVMHPGDAAGHVLPEASMAVLEGTAVLRQSIRPPLRLLGQLGGPDQRRRAVLLPHPVVAEEETGHPHGRGVPRKQGCAIVGPGAQRKQDQERDRKDARETAHVGLPLLDILEAVYTSRGGERRAYALTDAGPLACAVETPQPATQDSR